MAGHSLSDEYILPVRGRHVEAGRPETRAGRLR